MSKYPRVKDILDAYVNKGMVGVTKYFSDEDLIIDPNTWIGKMKRLLDSKNWRSMEAEIALILFNFKLIEENEKERERGDNSKLPNQGPSDRRDTSK